ncbi:MAG: NAD-dependent epimerase/dehydratase family protein [Gammaproteobacteria bacterium]|nr:NAD-dependent epimerase/dehydratase family protein [Gammaproteobacteria bacterium]
MSRKVLITGGAGFVGSHLADAHVARGDRVWVLDDLSAGRAENVPSGAEFVEMDIGDPRARELILDIGFDLINHHAAQIDVRASVADPIGDARVNIAGLINILEGARDAGTQRVVFVSSGGVVYGEPEVYPTPEDTPKCPVSPYGVSKLAGEYYLDYYREVHGLDYVALRYGNVYGPRQDPHGEAGVVAIFCNRLIDGEPLDIYGDGEQTRDYVYVEDVAAANLIASEMPLEDRAGIDARAYNVATGEATSVNTLATLLEEIAGARPGRIHKDARAGELRRSVLSTARMRAMGWSPAQSLREGLARTFGHIASGRTTRSIASKAQWPDE